MPLLCRQSELKAIAQMEAKILPHLFGDAGDCVVVLVSSKKPMLNRAGPVGIQTKKTSHRARRFHSDNGT